MPVSKEKHARKVRDHAPSRAVVRVRFVVAGARPHSGGRAWTGGRVQRVAELECGHEIVLGTNGHHARRRCTACLDVRADVQVRRLLEEIE